MDEECGTEDSSNCITGIVPLGGNFILGAASGPTDGIGRGIGRGIGIRLTGRPASSMLISISVSC